MECDTSQYSFVSSNEEAEGKNHRSFVCKSDSPDSKLVTSNLIVKNSDLKGSWFLGNQFFTNRNESESNSAGEHIATLGNGYGGIQFNPDLGSTVSQQNPKEGFIFSLWGGTNFENHAERAILRDLTHEQSGEGRFKSIFIPYDIEIGKEYQICFKSNEGNSVEMSVVIPEEKHKVSIGEIEWGNHSCLKRTTNSFLENFGERSEFLAGFHRVC